jgi:hypothetical protein
MRVNGQKHKILDRPPFLTTINLFDSKSVCPALINTRRDYPVYQQAYARHRGIIMPSKLLSKHYLKDYYIL